MTRTTNAVIVLVMSVIFAITAWEWFIWPADSLFALVSDTPLPRPYSLLDLQGRVLFYSLTWLMALSLSIAGWSCLPLVVLDFLCHVAAQIFQALRRAI